MVLEAEKRGIEPSPLLARLGLDSATVFDAERRVSFAALFSVWADCMRAVRDPGLPIAAAKRVRLEDYAVLGFAATSAPNFRAALAILARYGALHADGCRWELEEHGKLPGLKLRWERDGARSLGHRVANECAIAEALHAARQILGFTLVPDEIAFRHDAPSSVRAHEDFFGKRPRFAERWEGLSFSRDVLSCVPRQANPPLASWIERQMATMLQARVAPTTFGERVEQRLEQDLATGVPDLSRVARALALSERTLRRQLREENLTFRELWESVRRRRAEALLAAGKVTIDEIAFLTGFSEAPAFARAFKRWSGDTPGAFRKRATQPGDRIGQEAGRDGQ
jgi:AraC-like DNA-binding protein